MKIPESVVLSIKKGPMDNQYFYHAYAATERLSKIKNKEISFYNDDYATLINTLERLYKGFLQSKIDSGELNLPVGFLSSDHDCIKLVNEIEKFTPLFVINSKEDLRERDHFLIDLRRAYTSSRYYEDYSYEDFCALYDFVEKQKTVIEMYLTPQKETTKEDEFSIDL